MSDWHDRSIREIRAMTDEELAREHWHINSEHQRPPVIVLDDGTKLFPSRDPEGNGPGQLLGERPDGDLFQINARKKAEGEQ